MVFARRTATASRGSVSLVFSLAGFLYFGLGFVSGPLAGIPGKVVREGKRLKFVVEVTFLQQGVCLEIDAGMLEKRE